jgi:hypothetical protein
MLTEIGFLNILQLYQLTVKIFWSCEMRCSSKTGFLSFQQRRRVPEESNNKLINVKTFLLSKGSTPTRRISSIIKSQTGQDSIGVDTEEKTSLHERNITLLNALYGRLVLVLLIDAIQNLFT